jgi:hypothetical protein
LRVARGGYLSWLEGDGKNWFQMSAVSGPTTIGPIDPDDVLGQAQGSNLRGTLDDCMDVMDWRRPRRARGPARRNMPSSARRSNARAKFATRFSRRASRRDGPWIRPHVEDETDPPAMPSPANPGTPTRRSGCRQQDVGAPSSRPGYKREAALLRPEICACPSSIRGEGKSVGVQHRTATRSTSASRCRLHTVAVISPVA